MMVLSGVALVLDARVHGNNSSTAGHRHGLLSILCMSAGVTWRRSDYVGRRAGGGFHSHAGALPGSLCGRWPRSDERMGGAI